MESIKEEKDRALKEVEVHKMMLKSALAERERDSDDSEDEREKRRRRKRELEGDDEHKEKKQTAEVIAPVMETNIGGGLDLGGDNMSDGGPRGDFGGNEYNDNRSYNGSDNGGGFGGYREDDQEQNFEENYGQV
jgi:hypothetical protein